MKLNLKNDLVVLDLETTGLSKTKSYIIQIALLKLFADGRPDEMKKRYINPECDIPAEITEITGITNETVKEAMPFRNYAKGILTYLEGCDILTFNGNRFDIPILMEHLERCGLKLDVTKRRFIDAKRIYHRFEPRDLKAGYKFYTGEDMTGAHDAGNDCMATAKILECMIDRYEGVDCVDKHDVIIKEPIKNDMDALYEFTKDFDEIDFDGQVKYNKDGIPVLNFGKYQGIPVAKALTADKSYYQWIMGPKGDFIQDTRRVIESIMVEFRKTGKLTSIPQDIIQFRQRPDPSA